MDSLLSMNCQPCSQQSEMLTEHEQCILLEQLPQWQLLCAQPKQLQRQFAFASFLQAMQFVQMITDLAESHNHHPKLTIEWGQCTVYWWTHGIAGLHLNDFILAAKTEAMYGKL